MKFIKIKKPINEPEEPEIIYVSEEKIIVEPADTSKKCKRCKKDLIGKEKLFCRSCSMDLKANGKKVLAGVGTLAGVVIAVATGSKIEIKKK